ncbi:MAG: twitching motility protein PilT, partial [Anaerolineae bacterium]
MKRATFRFYAELNDFLPADRRQIGFRHSSRGQPSVKDTIEALGVPHTEVDLIVVNGESVAFSYLLQPEDKVSVYPVFESVDITPVLRLRPEPL